MGKESKRESFYTYLLGQVECNSIKEPIQDIDKANLNDNMKQSNYI